MMQPHPRHLGRLPAAIELATRLRPTATDRRRGHGACGAGLARYLHTERVTVVEVDRPDRKARRLQGKSDPVVAEAARAALSTRAHGVAKHRDGKVDALRNLRVARRCAIAHRADVLRRIRTLIVTAPEPLREQLRGHATAHLIRACTALRPDTSRADPRYTEACVRPDRGTSMRVLCPATGEERRWPTVSNTGRRLSSDWW